MFFTEHYHTEHLCSLARLLEWNSEGPALGSAQWRCLPAAARGQEWVSGLGGGSVKLGARSGNSLSAAWV